MTKRDDETRLQDLPRPQSPSALDARILATAKSRAPQRRARRGFAVLGGLASTAVLVVAVMLTLPDERQTPSTKGVARDAAGGLELADEAAVEVATDSAQQNPFATMYMMPRPHSRTEIAQSLNACRELSERESIDEGERCYQMLRSFCRNCDLPDSFEAALHRYEQPAD